jgi:hypothetical protein
MKLLKSGSCQWEPDGGNVKALTALGDAHIDISSDRGSTPLASTKIKGLLIVRLINSPSILYRYKLLCIGFFSLLKIIY